MNLENIKIISISVIVIVFWVFLSVEFIEKNHYKKLSDRCIAQIQELKDESQKQLEQVDKINSEVVVQEQSIKTNVESIENEKVSKTCKKAVAWGYTQSINF